MQEQLDRSTGYEDQRNWGNSSRELVIKWVWL